MAFLTVAGEQKIAYQQGNSLLFNVTHFVLANIAGLGAEPVDRIEAMPVAGNIVDTRPVTRAGYVNANQVVYSLTLDGTIGDYTFNWVGLKDADGVLVAVVHLADPITKTATAGGIEGNNLVRNFLLQYTGLTATTAISAPAETWQIDFTTRLLQIDERERLSNFDIYGQFSALDDGFLVTLVSGSDYEIAAGVCYVGGIRCEQAAAEPITVTGLPKSIWIDASLQGDLTGVDAVFSFTATAATLTDYTDGLGFDHYVAKIADISAGGVVTDARVSSNDFATKLGVQQVAYSSANAGGTVNAVTAAFVPAIEALTHGMTVHVKLAGENTGTTPTFTPAAGVIAAKTVVKGDNLPLMPGDLSGWAEFRYDQNIDKWVLKNPATGVYASVKPGLTLSNNAGSPNSVIDISAGRKRAASDNYDLRLTAALSKTLQAVGSWAAGNNQNGLFSGARSNSTWYHLFLIRKDADKSIDAGLDISIAAANRPAGYSEYCRLGSVLTDGSGNIRAFIQAGNLFLFKQPVLDMASVVTSTISTNYVISTPPGIKCLAKLFPTLLGNESQIYIRDPDAVDLAPAVPNNLNLAILSATTSETMSGEISLMTNVSSQIAIRRGPSPVDMTLLTHGWTDFSI